MAIPKSAPKELEREILTFERKQGEILKHAGKYVLIQGDEIASYSKSYDQASAEGYKRFGLENFLVKEVAVMETPLRAMRCGVRTTDGKLRASKARAR